MVTVRNLPEALPVAGYRSDVHRQTIDAYDQGAEHWRSSRYGSGTGPFEVAVEISFRCRARVGS